MAARSCRCGALTLRSAVAVMVGPAALGHGQCSAQGIGCSGEVKR